ncbi:TBC1 domain, member 5 [Mortierella sp. NVP85]|nr:TBC1 domain, member 5 [Mortierella sp. NVP85]
MGTARERYDNLRRKYIRGIGSEDGPEPDLEVNNPLSLAEDSPWQQFFMDSELKKIIKQDVERTLPDNDYFRSEKVQEQLNDILFIYCKINHDVSYRQGMHELVAHILWVVSSESLDADVESGDTSDNALDVMKSVLDSKYIEHDTFALFSSLMSRAKPWYEFSDEATPNRKAKVCLPETGGVVHAPPPGKQTPVIEWSMKIFHYLERIDNDLFLHLKSHEIQPQLFGIRWFRLLFGREFPMDDVLILWDGIFAKDPSLDICIFIGLAMLLRIRDDLLEEDFAGCLHKLMRYPSVKDIQMFIPQALSLQKLPNAAGGYEIIRQNSASSGKPLPPLPAEATETEQSRQNQSQQQHRPPRVASPSPYSRQSSYHAPQNQHSNQTPSNGVLSQHLPPAAYDAIKPVAEGLASVTKGVLESKGGAALNKAIHDMKKNTQSYIRKVNIQTSSPPDTGFPPNIEQTISSTNRATSSHHPAPPQQKNQSSHVSNNNSGKELQMQLGQIVAKALAILDTELLSTSSGDKANQDSSKKPTQSALAAMSGLEHVRDILLGFSKDFNPLVIESRMLGTPVNSSDDAGSRNVRQGVIVSAPIPTLPPSQPPQPSQDVQGVAATPGVQQRKPVHGASVTRSNSSGQVRTGNTARSTSDTPERRGISRTSSHSGGVLGQYDQGYRSLSPTPAAQLAKPQPQTPTLPPPAPAPVQAPVPAPAPKPFSFDDLIDDTPAASARLGSPSSSASRSAGVSGQPARAKSPRSSLTHSQFSWILNQDSNNAQTGGGILRHAGDTLSSSTSRTKVDPLVGGVSSRPKAGSLLAGHGLNQAQEDDPLRS